MPGDGYVRDHLVQSLMSFDGDVVDAGRHLSDVKISARADHLRLAEEDGRRAGRSEVERDGDGRGGRDSPLQGDRAGDIGVRLSEADARAGDKQSQAAKERRKATDIHRNGPFSREAELIFSASRCGRVRARLPTTLPR